MIETLKQAWEDAKEETKEERARIHAYWDEKTLFVHRRALIIGVIIGGIEGAIIGSLLTILYFIHTM